MYYTAKKLFYFTDKANKVSLRLNPMVTGRTLYMDYKGALRQCKVLSATIKHCEEDIENFIQSVKVNIAGVGIVRLDTKHYDTRTMGKVIYCRDPKFYTSVEDFEDKNYTSIYITETEESLASEMGIPPLYWYKQTGCMGEAWHYSWDGTKVVRKDFKFDIEKVTFNADGSVDMGVSIDNKNLYASARECENANSISIVCFPDEECGKVKTKDTHDIVLEKMKLEVWRGLVNRDCHVEFEENPWGILEAWIEDEDVCIGFCNKGKATELSELEEYCAVYSMLMDI